MTTRNGKIVLMGSGELTASMVEVHKTLLRQLPENPMAVFLDTPAGFQLNVDQISARAVDYFRTHVQHPLTVASYKSRGTAGDVERQQGLHALRRADYILIGPGSPTYAVRQWRDSPVPELLSGCVSTGGCLVAASAAALTMGRYTLPVYEIYKVGHDLRWIDGLDLLGRFGLDLVVVPHWNNAEGGTHDTRFCFMGATRFDALEALLPTPTPVLGIDEHTACVVDLAADQVAVQGIGGATLRTPADAIHFHSGDRFDLAVLRDGTIARHPRVNRSSPPPAPPTADAGQSFWEGVHDLERRFDAGLTEGDARAATNALLEFDRILWQAHERGEDDSAVVQARDSLRDMIVRLGNALDRTDACDGAALAPLVEALLKLRRQLRREKQWPAADMLRDALNRMNIQVEDTPDGDRWRMTTP